MAEQTNTGNAARPKVPPSRQISAKQMETLFRSAAFGDIVSILMRAPRHKKLSLDALRVFILPAVLNSQYMVARFRQQADAGAVPAGVAIWASVSDEVDKRLRTNPQQQVKLAPEEWKSGPNLWLVDLVAPTALAATMLKDVDEKVAKGKPMAAQVVSNDGAVKLTTVKELRAGIEKEKVPS
jgi:cytolysin-activating lysine-acyltransferase